MDSNNFNNGMNGQAPQPGPQPMNGIPDQANGMPINNDMPMGQPYPQQSMNGGMPMGQPYPQQSMNGGMPMGQPYPQQPMMKPPKQPMDPAKKKKIILIVSILSGVAVVGIALAIILPIVLRVDYTSAYETVSKMNDDGTAYNIYSNYEYGCEQASYYVDSQYVSISSYNEYIDRCKKVYSGDAVGQINELGETAGVQRNEEIKAAFNAFKAAYDDLIPDDTANLEQNLDSWKAWHSFVVNEPDSYSDVTDSKIETAANYLINSNNGDLTTYGKTWLEKRLDLANTYKQYRSSSSVSYSDYSNKRAEFENWVDENEPDIKTVVSIDFGSGNAYSVYDTFDNLYRKIRDVYNKDNAKHYTIPDSPEYYDDLDIFN